MINVPGSVPGIDAATEVLANAIRLYRDAQLLFTHDRYGSCASLAILALEELTKFMALAGFQALHRDQWRCHPAKQVGSASFLLRNRYQAALREMIVEHQLSEADYKQFAAMEYQADEMAFFDTVLAKIVADRSLARFSRAHAKETDRLKQRGFYVDMDRQDRVLSTPAQVTREIAEDHLKFAREVFEVLRSKMGQ